MSNILASQSSATSVRAGSSPREQARDVAAALAANARTTAEVLKELRRAFPDMPLAERVAALAAVVRI
jgi:hypothetical protein